MVKKIVASAVCFVCASAAIAADTPSWKITGGSLSLSSERKGIECNTKCTLTISHRTEARMEADRIVSDGEAAEFQLFGAVRASSNGMAFEAYNLTVSLKGDQIVIVKAESFRTVR